MKVTFHTGVQFGNRVRNSVGVAADGAIMTWGPDSSVLVEYNGAAIGVGGGTWSMVDLNAEDWAKFKAQHPHLAPKIEPKKVVASEEKPKVPTAASVHAPVKGPITKPAKEVEEKMAKAGIKF